MGKISCVGDEYRENEDGKRLDSLKKGPVFLFSYKNMNMEKVKIYKIKREGMVLGYRNGVSMGWDASDRNSVWCVSGECR